MVVNAKYKNLEIHQEIINSVKVIIWRERKDTLINLKPTLSQYNIYNINNNSQNQKSKLLSKEKENNNNYNVLKNNINFQSSIFNFQFLKSAFSLIELSIVLVIIGLLVAGITGGASLVESARVRALITELRDYERAVYTFQAAKGRYPGDPMDYGTFGVWSNYYDPTSTSTSYARPGYTYQDGDFSESFRTEFKSNNNGSLPDYISAPFVDLYTEGIIDFKPLGNKQTANKTDTKKATPNSKAIDTNDVHLRFDYVGGNTYYYTGTPAPGKEWKTGVGKFGSMKEALGYYFDGSSASKPEKGMNPKILKQVDLKLDDGEYWNGRIRGSCRGLYNGNPSNDSGYTDYDYAIDNNKKCPVLYYAL